MLRSLARLRGPFASVLSLGATLGMAASTAVAGFEDCNLNGLDDSEDIALGIS